MSRSIPLRVLQLLIGLTLYGIGIGLMVQGVLGVSPWDVLAQGIANVSGLEFGLVMFFVSVGIFVLWIPLRQRPGVGTVLNIVVVPIAAQATIWLLPPPEELWLRILLLAGGIWVIGVATGIYLGARFGPGPRDGLMTGLHAVTGWPIWLVRTLLEVAVVIGGWLLGGDAFVGTLAFALLIGPIVGLSIPWFDRQTRHLAPRGGGRSGRGRPGGPSGTSKPSEPGQPGRQAGPSDPGKPDEPSDPGKPGPPTEPDSRDRTQPDPPG